jgi:hypothetical protein
MAKLVFGMNQSLLPHTGFAVGQATTIVIVCALYRS